MLSIYYVPDTVLVAEMSKVSKTRVSTCPYTMSGGSDIVEMQPSSDSSSMVAEDPEEAHIHNRCCKKMWQDSVTGDYSM